MNNAAYIYHLAAADALASDTQARSKRFASQNLSSSLSELRWAYAI